MGNFDFESGRRCLQEGEYVEAIRCLLASLDQDPSCVEAYVVLAAAYWRAWDESADALVVEQIRKVAVAGLKRDATDAQRRRLQGDLDRAEAILAQIRREEEEEAALEERPRPRGLPVLKD